MAPVPIYEAYLLKRSGRPLTKSTLERIGREEEEGY